MAKCAAALLTKVSKAALVVKSSALQKNTTRRNT